MLKLKGKVAIITGGTSGIGEATLRLFIENGAKVCFTGRRSDRGTKLMNELLNISQDVLYVNADHRIPEDCHRTVEETMNRFGAIHILFNNAGVVFQQDAEHTNEEEWDEVMNINVKSVWRMTKLLLPIMRQNPAQPERGSIINNASDWGLVGGLNAVAYCASKGAVIQMTKAVALDVAKDNIRVNAVCPGDTFVERWIERDRDLVLQPGEIVDDTEVERRLRINQSIPLRRTGDVNEIAKGVLFMASSDSSYMTGTTLVIDGGNTAQ